jgi:hypothetical protein
MAMVLLATSVPGASRARSEREGRMIPKAIDETAVRPASHVLIVDLPGEFLGEGVTLRAVASVGPAPPVPPGLSRPLAPGEVAVSPVLSRLLGTPVGQLLRPRLPGRIVRIVGSEGLPSSDALVGYVGVPVSVLASPEVVVGFGPRLAHNSQPVGLGAWIAASLLVVGILAPIAILLAAATRLSSRTMEARLSVLRLVGAKVGFVRALAATESALLAFVGAAVGIPVFFLGRRMFAQFLPDPFRWFPEDLVVSLNGIVGWWFALVAFSVAVSLVSSRQIVFTPIAVVRRMTRQPGRPIGPWLVLTGLALLGISAAFALLRWQIAVPAMTLGLICTVVGVVLGLPWLVWRVASWLARTARRTSLVLGTHALAADPGSLGRAASAIAIVVLIGGTGQAIVLASGFSRQTIGLQRAEREPNVVFVSFGRESEPVLPLLERVAGVEGIERRPTDVWGGTGLRYLAVSTNTPRVTQERIRNALAFRTTALVVDSAASMRERQLARWYTLRGVADGSITVVLFVVWFGLIVTSIQRTLEQRRSMAGLAAVGASRRVLRASAIYQVVLPLGLSVALGWFVSLPVTTLLFSAVEERLLLPVRFTVWLILVLLVLTVTTTMVMVPWIKAVVAPSSLRPE